MDPLTIILLTIGAAALIGLAWLSGYDIGRSAATDAERALANRRINGLLKQENARKPRKQRAAK